MVSNGNLKSEGRYKIEPGEGGGGADVYYAELRR